MNGRLENRREEAKSRRRTLRQSVLDERRGAAGLSDEERAPRQTRAGQAKKAAKEAVTKKLEEWRRRKALAAKEIQKARPAFNPYVRVKHTGLSPYSIKMSKSPKGVHPRITSRAVLPQTQPSRTTRAKTQTSEPSRNPGPKTKAPVQRNPLVPTFNGQTSFKPPAKIQPLPLTNRPARNVRSEQKDPPQREVKLRPKVAQGPKEIPKVAPVKPLKALPPKVQVPAKSTVRQTSEIPMAKPTLPNSAVPPHKVLLQSRKTTTNKKVSIRKAQTISKLVEPSTRVLRSSTRPVQVGKENVSPREAVQPKQEANLSSQEKVVAVDTKGKAERKICVPLVKQHVENEASSTPDGRSSGLQERRDKLQSETDRLRSLHDEWLAVRDNVVLPDGVVDEIDAVTGQTNLLITKKFRQFEGLIDSAVTNPKTTLEDLDGFWDMVYIQVDQLDGKFQALQKMKEQNWNSKSPPVFKHVQIRDRKLSRRVGKSNFLKTLAEKKKNDERPAEMSDASEPQCSQEERVEVTLPGARLPVALSPLNISIDGSPFRANSSFHSLISPKRSTPRAVDNQRRASRSTRFSHAIIRLSSLVDNSLNGSNLDE